MTIARRRVLYTIWHGGAGTSLTGGALPASRRARNAFTQAQRPEPLRSHGDAVDARESYESWRIWGRRHRTLTAHKTVEFSRKRPSPD